MQKQVYRHATTWMRHTPGGEMKKTGYLHDNRYLLHDTGPYHPERPERLQAIHSGIEEAGLLSNLTMIDAKIAEMKWIGAVHDESYIRRFEEVCLSGNPTFDYPDNQMCVETFHTARLAAGGVIEAARMVLAGEIDNAFCAIRPPGHHAEVDKAMGFCYFNNVAIAARYLQMEWKIKKVAIIDMDVHHGNGTQHIFEKDPSVYYYSVHEHPSFAFPGTGRSFEKGSGEGTGRTRNHPVLPGKGDAEYKKIIENDLIPSMKRFSPEVILVSAGFDAHADDDMAGINLSTRGYSWMMEKILDIAENHSDGRLISVLEGGYSLGRLPELARDHVSVLLNRR
jgi:acetoin utilization deacetylase AcuC-like enzyme